MGRRCLWPAAASSEHYGLFNSAGTMSNLDHERRFCRVAVMSALPPKADIRPRDQDVRFGP